MRIYLLSTDEKFMVGKADVNMDVPFVGLKLPIKGDAYLEALGPESGPQIMRRQNNKPFKYDKELGRENVNEWVYLPLAIQQQLLGMLVADNKFSKRPIPQEVIEPLSIFSAQAAAAINQARFIENEQINAERALQRTRNREAIRQVFSTINSKSSLQDIFKLVCTAVVNLFHVNHCGLVRFSQDLTEGIVVAEYPNMGMEKQSIPVKNVPVEQQLLTTKQTFKTSNVSNEPGLQPVLHILAEHNIQSILITPIVVEDKVIGSFSLDVIGRSYQFTDEEVDLCKIFAAQIAIAIQNAELLAEATKQASRSEEKLKRLQKLAKASNKIMQSLGDISLTHRLRIIAKHATEILNAEVCGMSLVRADGTLQFAADYGYDDKKQLKPGHQFVIQSGHGTGLTGHIAYQGKLFNEFGAKLINHFAVKGDEANTASGKCYSLLAIPLKKQIGAEQKLVGLLRIENKKDKDGKPGLHIGFSAEDESTLRLFAADVVVAIENAGLVQKLHKRKEQYARLVGSSPIAIIANDQDGLITVFNKQAEEILKYSCDEIIGDPVRKVFADAQEATIIGQLVDGQGQLSRYETMLHSKEKKRIPIRLTVIKSINSDGEQTGYVGYFEDLRDIRETREHLDLILSATQLLTQAKSLHKGLQRLAEMMVTYWESSFCRIFLLDPTETYLEIAAAYPAKQMGHGQSWHPGVGEIIKIDEWPRLDELLRKWDSNIIKLTSQNGRFILQKWSQKLNLEQEIQSLLVLPMRTHDNRVVGLFDLGELRPWEIAQISKEQQKLAEAIGKQTAALIDRFRLHETTKQAKESLRASYEASNALVSSREPDAIWQGIMEQARKVAQSRDIRVVLVDLTTLNREVVFKTESIDLKDKELIRPDGLSVEIVKTGRPEVIPNVLNAVDRINPSFVNRNIKAALGLPISLEGNRIGVMWLYYGEPHYFSEQEVEALQLYVNQAAIAYENARRFTELEQMRKVVETIAGADTVDGVLQHILSGTRKLLQAESAAIWAYDNDLSKFILEDSVSDGISPSVWRAFLQIEPHTNGIVNAVMLSGWHGIEDTTKSQYAAILRDDTRIRLNNIGVQSFQGIALCVGEEKLGVLFANYKRIRHFSEKDQEKARSFANHAALSLKKAQLWERITKVYQTTSIVAGVSTLARLEDTLHSVVKGMKDALGCDVVTLHIYGQNRQKTIFPFTHVGLNHPDKIPAPPPTGMPPLIEQILQQDDQQWFVEDNKVDATPGNGRFTRDENIRSWVATRLQMGDEIVGVVFTSYRSKRRFTKDELENVKLFANQAAVAIHNAQLYEKIQRHSSALEALHEAGQAITSTFNRDKILRRIVEQVWHLVSYGNRQINYASIWLIQEKPEAKKARLVAAYPPDEMTTTLDVLGDEIDWVLGKDGRSGIMGRVLKTGKSEIVEDVTQDPDYLASHKETLSELAVPIKLEHGYMGVIGVLNVQHSDYSAFDEEDQQALQALAAQAAIALENSRLYSDVQKRATILEALDKAVHAVTSTLNLNETLGAIAKQAGKLTGATGKEASFSHLALLDGKTLSFEATYPPYHLSGLKEKVGDINISEKNGPIGISGRAVKTGQPILVPDVTKSSDYIKYDSQTRSELAVPIKSEKRIIGAINVEYPEIDAFDDQDVHALMTLAEHAAIAIQNAQLYKWLNTVARISSKAATSLDISPLLRTVCAWLEQDARANAIASVRLYEPKNNRLIFDPNWHRSLFETIDIEEEEGRTSQLIGVGICGWVAQHKQAIIVGDVTAPNAHPKALRLVSSTRSELCVPILYGEERELIGVLHMQSPEVNAFAESDQRFLETLADQLAVAIRKAQDYEKLENTYEELENTKGLVGSSTALAWMGMASNTWRHSIEGDALSIRFNIELLQSRANLFISDPTSLAEVKKRLEKVHELANKILARPITPPLGSEEGVEEVIVNDFLTERISQLWKNEPYNSIDYPVFGLESTNKVTVTISPEWLRRAFDLVIDNAVKVMKEQPKKQLSINTTINVNNKISILIKDSGGGIPLDIKDKLLKERIEGSDGMGMGMLMVQAIIQAYSGEVTIYETGLKGTTIAITLPKTS
ncbi:MAG: GAF domain-containing protein [Chloroflexi bacterium]|nr:MAG: GAF domain-containing protein [Chloroflexota bacterium]